MSSEWTKFTDLLSAIVDNRGRTCPVGESGLPLIATNCVSGVDLYPSYDTTRFVSEETYKTWFRGHPKPGDILFVCKGSPGRTNWVPDPVDFCIAQDMVAVRADTRKVYPKYLFAALRSEVVRSQIDNMHVGTMIPHFKKGDFDKLLIPMLDEQAQVAVGDFYFTLSERITLLRETNATLEAIAQALFKSWFVDFDPVRAKMEGRAPEGMDEATAALFPDALEETELGPMPRGWRVGCVDDLCSVITNGGTPSRSKAQFWTGGTIPWFKTGEFSDGFLLQPNEFITKEALEGSSVKVLPKDAVLMAIYAAPTVGRLGVLTEPATFNQACTGMVAKVDVGPWFLYWTLFFGREWFNSRANGAAQQNISKAIVSAYRVVIPHDVILLAFNDVASSIHNRVRENAEQAQTLATLRDTLLPRLISGQLSISDTGLQIEEAIV
jgi:type I restriction enzyme S subunit